MLTTSTLPQAAEKYNVTADNIYNLDEKGFVIGMRSASKCTVTQESLNSGGILGTSQDGSRESVSMLAYMCVDQTFLLPPYM